MTKDELQNHCWTLEAILEYYDEWRHEKRHYERTGSWWKPKWKHAKNILTKYDVKLSHIAEFGENEGQYSAYYNEISILPRQMFTCMEVDEHMGICHYYLILWHEIFHCVINHEFHLSAIINKNAEEIIVEEAVKNIVLEDICGEYSYMSNKFAFDASLKNGSYHIAPEYKKIIDKFSEDLDKYILEYKDKIYYDDASYTVFENQKAIIHKKLKEVYDECRPA